MTAEEYKNLEISIHTALAGCDNRIGLQFEGFKISIHTALAGCDIWAIVSQGAIP